ncbi:hypothetical protein ACJZ2D_000799 [Fusarium nematophilum]
MRDNPRLTHILYVCEVLDPANAERLPAALDKVYGKGNYTMDISGGRITVKTDSLFPPDLRGRLREMNILNKTMTDIEESGDSTADGFPRAGI